MARKFKKVVDMVEPFNRYKRALLLSYYSLTRNEYVIDVIEKSKEENFFENLYPEFLQYLSGQDIVLSKEEDTFKVANFLPSNTNYNTTTDKIENMIKNMQIKLNQDTNNEETFKTGKSKRGRKPKLKIEYPENSGEDDNLIGTRISD